MNENNTTANQHLPSGDIDIRGLFSVIWNQKRLLLLVVALGALLTFFLTLFISTSYTASSNILIDKEDNSYQELDLTAAVKSFSIDAGFILTEIEILKSRTLIAKTVEHLNLMKDPEFNQGPNQNQDILDLEPNQKITTPPENIDNNHTVTNFIKALRVTSIPGSMAVKISFTSKDAKKAALITNTLVDEYIKQRINNKYNEQRQLTKWLDKRINHLHDQVLESEMKTEQYRAANNLSVGKRDLISSEQLSALNNQYMDAQKNYSDLKAQLKQLNKSGSVDISSAPNSLNASVLKNLNIERLTLETSLSELSSRYGPKHPTMIKKQAELAEVQGKINQQSGKAKQTLKNEIAVAKAQLNEVNSIIKDAKGQSDTDGSAMIKLRELEREALTSRNILKTFLEKYKRVVGKDMIQEAGARVISYANVPTIPSSPDKKLILALGTFVSFILGLALLFLNEKLYNKFRSTEDLEAAYNTPCLGSIPFTRSGWNKNLVAQTLSNPASPITESLRNIRLALKNQKSKTGDAPKVISVLSSVKNEGKTTTAVLLAALAAKAGERVILIDTNLRTPCVHTNLSESNDDNLVDFLTNQKDLNDVIHKDKDTGMHIIFGSSVPNNAFNLLSLKKLDTLIDALRDSYDLVVIDTPPCSTASDARLVEQLSDFSLFSVRYNTTKDKTLTQNVTAFLRHENPALGFLLTYVK